MKPTPSHRQRIRVLFAVVAKGYGGERAFRGLPGLWQIVGADSEKESYLLPTNATGYINLVIAPARGGK